MLITSTKTKLRRQKVTSMLMTFIYGKKLSRKATFTSVSFFIAIRKSLFVSCIDMVHVKFISCQEKGDGETVKV